MGNFSFHEKKSLVLIVVMSMSEAFNSVAFYFTAFYSTAYYCAHAHGEKININIALGFESI